MLGFLIRYSASDDVPERNCVHQGMKAVPLNTKAAQLKLTREKV